jgi:hypothetical protein
MSPTKSTATKSVTYNGGLDAVVIHLPSGAVEFPRGTPVEVSAEDASVLSDNSDFKAPTKAASTPTTKPSEEV